MTIEDLCSGSTATVQEAANTKDSMGGNVPGYADTATTVTFLLQSASVNESLRYDARGEETIYNGFFSSNPSLTPQNRLKVTKWMGETLTTPRYLRVLNTEREGTPDEARLWIVAMREDTLDRAG